MKILKLATLLALLLPVFASAQDKVQLHPGTVFYVDRDAPLAAPPGFTGADRGQSWDYAFREVYEAFAIAEQGDVILVAGTEGVFARDLGNTEGGVDNDPFDTQTMIRNHVFPNISDVGPGISNYGGLPATWDPSAEPEFVTLNNAGVVDGLPEIPKDGFDRVNRPFKPDVSGWYNRIPGVREHQMIPDGYLNNSPLGDTHVASDHPAIALRGRDDSRLATFYIGAGLLEWNDTLGLEDVQDGNPPAVVLPADFYRGTLGAFSYAQAQDVPVIQIDEFLSPLVDYAVIDMNDTPTVTDETGLRCITIVGGFNGLRTPAGAFIPATRDSDGNMIFDRYEREEFTEFSGDIGSLVPRSANVAASTASMATILGEENPDLAPASLTDNVYHVFTIGQFADCGSLEGGEGAACLDYGDNSGYPDFTEIYGADFEELFEWYEDQSSTEGLGLSDNEIIDCVLNDPGFWRVNGSRSVIIDGYKSVLDPLQLITIKFGYADGNLNAADNPLLTQDDGNGGAIRFISGDPEERHVIKGITFVRNFAFLSGGAIAIGGGGVTNLDNAQSTFFYKDTAGELESGQQPIIIKNVFIDNDAEQESGGAIWNNSAEFSSGFALPNTQWSFDGLNACPNDEERYVHITHNFFLRNTSGRQGGAVYTTAEAFSNVSNNVMYDNAADQEGGAIYFAVNSFGLAVNNTIAGNVAENAGGAVFLGTNSNAYLANNAIWDNRLPGGPIDQVRGPARGTIANPDTTLNRLTQLGNVVAAPDGADENELGGLQVFQEYIFSDPFDLNDDAEIELIAGADGVYGTVDDGLHVQFLAGGGTSEVLVDLGITSLADTVVDYGNLRRLTSFSICDFCSGYSLADSRQIICLQPRVQGASIDVGAYEAIREIPPVPVVIYVDDNAPGCVEDDPQRRYGVHDGNTWQTAYLTVQDALKRAELDPTVDEIWVAQAENVSKSYIAWTDVTSEQVANAGVFDYGNGLIKAWQVPFKDSQALWEANAELATPAYIPGRRSGLWVTVSDENGSGQVNKDGFEDQSINPYPIPSYFAEDRWRELRSKAVTLALGQNFNTPAPMTLDCPTSPAVDLFSNLTYNPFWAYSFAYADPDAPVSSVSPAYSLCVIPNLQVQRRHPVDNCEDVEDDPGICYWTVPVASTWGGFVLEGGWSKELQPDCGTNAWYELQYYMITETIFGDDGDPPANGILQFGYTYNYTFDADGNYDGPAVVLDDDNRFLSPVPSETAPWGTYTNPIDLIPAIDQRYHIREDLSTGNNPTYTFRLRADYTDRRVEVYGGFFGWQVADVEIVDGVVVDYELQCGALEKHRTQAVPDTFRPDHRQTILSGNHLVHRGNNPWKPFETAGTHSSSWRIVEITGLGSVQDLRENDLVEDGLDDQFPYHPDCFILDGFYIQDAVADYEDDYYNWNPCDDFSYRYDVSGGAIGTSYETTGWGYSGAGVTVYAAEAILHNLVVQDNIALGNGAGIYNFDGNPMILNSNVQYNLANSSSTRFFGVGGGLYNWNEGAFEIYNSNFLENQAADGAAIFSADPARHRIEASIFAGNVAAGGGGAIFLQDSLGMEVYTTLFQRNVAQGDDGGAIYLANSNANVANSAFLYNRAGFGNQGRAVYADGNLFVTESVIWDNFTSPGLYFAGDLPEVTYSAIRGGYSTGIPEIDSTLTPLGVDNMSSDGPQFEDPDVIMMTMSNGLKSTNRTIGGEAIDELKGFAKGPFFEDPVIEGDPVEGVDANACNPSGLVTFFAFGSSDSFFGEDGYRTMADSPLRGAGLDGDAGIYDSGTIGGPDQKSIVGILGGSPDGAGWAFSTWFGFYNVSEWIQPSVNVTNWGWINSAAHGFIAIWNGSNPGEVYAYDMELNAIWWASEAASYTTVGEDSSFGPVYVWPLDGNPANWSWYAGNVNDLRRFVIDFTVNPMEVTVPKN